MKEFTRGHSEQVDPANVADHDRGGGCHVHRYQPKRRLQRGIEVSGHRWVGGPSQHPVRGAHPRQSSKAGRVGGTTRLLARTRRGLPYAGDPRRPTATHLTGAPRNGRKSGSCGAMSFDQLRLSGRTGRRGSVLPRDRGRQTCKRSVRPVGWASTSKQRATRSRL